ncbi:MAG: DUF397 domain-containing protein [Pseudonocardiaceae bacterium]
MTHDLTLAWRKSSHSNELGACCEVADLDGGRAVRDSKDPARPGPEVHRGRVGRVHRRCPGRRVRLIDRSGPDSSPMVPLAGPQSLSRAPAPLSPQCAAWQRRRLPACPSRPCSPRRAPTSRAGTRTSSPVPSWPTTARCAARW